MSDSLYVKNDFWRGIIVKKNSRVYNLREAQNIVQSVPEAKKLLKSARGDKTITGILGAIGGFGIGWSIGTAINDRVETNWTPALVGAGVLVVSIPINSSAKRKTKEAVRIYNRSLD